MTTDVIELMEKANRSLKKSARLVFADGDPDGACNRAYYAMFSAARAALLAIGHVEESQGKTHSGLIAAFGLHLVKSGHIPAEHGRALNAIFQLRAKADYLDSGVSTEDARLSIKKADEFLTVVNSQLLAQ